MTQATTIISKLTVNDHSVVVQWADGHVSEYDNKYLRISCSCAECIEEWTRRPLLNPASIAANIKVEDYLMVGKYAVQFLWSDAHYTGIYPFEVLRKLCRCEVCKPAAS
jgi:DUF971 family protein